MKVSDFVEWWIVPSKLKEAKTNLSHCWDWAVEDAFPFLMEELEMDYVELQREASNFYDGLNEEEENED